MTKVLALDEDNNVVEVLLTSDAGAQGVFDGGGAAPHTASTPSIDFGRAK